jgi:hypothetical protein
VAPAAPLFPLLQVLALNRRVQAQNRAPVEFPGFVRQGFDIVIIADGYAETPNGCAARGWRHGRRREGGAMVGGGAAAAQPRWSCGGKGGPHPHP